MRAPSMTRAETSADPRARRALAVFAIFATSLLVASAACEPRAPEHDPTPRETSTSPATTTRTPAPLGGTSAGISWIELVTGNAAPSDALPMIVALHGLGDRPQSFIQVLAAFPGRARIIAMRAPQPYGDGFSWFRLVDHEIDSDAAATAIGAAADQLAPAIAAVAHERPTVGLPIVTGFSQGGALSFAIAARHPDQIAAAFPLSGWLPPGLAPAAASPSARPPVFAFHGTADERVPFADGKGTVARLVAAGYHAELRELPGMGHTVGSAERTELYRRIEGTIASSAAPKPL
jgi:phospholipase/carboxylesterase